LLLFHLFLQETTQEVESKIDIRNKMLKFEYFYRNTKSQEVKAKLISGENVKVSSNLSENLKEVFFSQDFCYTGSCNIKMLQLNRTDQQEFTNYVITKFKTIYGQLNNLIYKLHMSVKNSKITEPRL
jgi:hypothetical protein